MSSNRAIKMNRDLGRKENEATLTSSKLSLVVDAKIYWGTACFFGSSGGLPRPRVSLI